MRKRGGVSANQTRDERERPPESKVVGIFGLSLYTDETALRDRFGKFGRIEKCSIVYDRQTQRSRGFGFITFDDIADAADAVRDYEKNSPEMDGRRVRVAFSLTRKAHSPTPGQYMGEREEERRREQAGRGGGGGGGYGRDRDRGGRDFGRDRDRGGRDDRRRDDRRY